MPASSTRGQLQAPGASWSLPSLLHPWPGCCRLFWDCSPAVSPQPRVGSAGTPVQNQWPSEPCPPPTECPLLPGLTIPVLVGQPVVLSVTMLEVQVPLPALLLTEVGQRIRAVLGAAELEIVGEARAGAAPIGWAGGESREAFQRGAARKRPARGEPPVGLAGIPEPGGEGAAVLSEGTQPCPVPELWHVGAGEAGNPPAGPKGREHLLSPCAAPAPPRLL